MKKNNRNGKLIAADEIMSKYNISYQTVNHYTNFGLLTISARNGNVRFYDRDLVDKRLKKIKSLMNEGYTLRLIQKKLLGKKV